MASVTAGFDAAQVVRFLVAGVAVTGLDVLVFYGAALSVFPSLTPSDPVVRVLGSAVRPVNEAVRSVNYLRAKVLSFVVANAAGYAVNVRWVFTPGRHQPLAECALFFAGALLSSAAGAALGWTLIRCLRRQTTHAYAADALVCVVANYALRKFVIFAS